MKPHKIKKKSPKAYRVNRIASIGLLLFACQNHIIERAASDYFPWAEGNWWCYSDAAAYEPNAIFVEVEPADTILQIICYPFSFSGKIHYFTKDHEAIKEYVKIDHYFSGNEYRILEGFVTKIELPLIANNSYRDSICDSVNVAGVWIKGKYQIQGLVAESQEEKLYGEVYKVVLNRTETITIADSVINRSDYLEEYYAPQIGLVRFKNSQNDFKLVEYQVK